mmetsp:Transcript_7707/g.17829  ORF Transcript_7707/g.17829 Transcript_7707/m.17829 type:complete len:200 (-) Transcript_7707:78-677(-)
MVASFRTLFGGPCTSAPPDDPACLLQCMPMEFCLDVDPKEADEVYLSGSFCDNWNLKIRCRKDHSRRKFTAVVQVPPGKHTYKFLAVKDGQSTWHCGPGLRVFDKDGHENNQIVVEAPSDPALDLTNSVPSLNSLSRACTPKVSPARRIEEPPRPKKQFGLYQCAVAGKSHRYISPWDLMAVDKPVSASLEHASVEYDV